jgi:hypothetical protein
MGSVIGTLREQGQRVENARDGNGHPLVSITDPEDGCNYIVPLIKLEELQRRGKLSIEGIKQHDEVIRKAGNV